MSVGGPVRAVGVITRLNVGGPARHALLLAKLLPVRGVESELIYGSVGAGERQLDPAPGLPTVHVPQLQRSIRPHLDVAVFLVLRRLIRSRRPSFVHTHTAKAGTLGRLAAIRERVPVIVHTFHGHVLEGYFSPITNRTFVKIERLLARRTDVLIAVSEVVRDELLDLGIGRAEQWRIIPLGLDLSALLSSAPDQRAARMKLGLPSEGLLVGIVGRLVPVKDHATFVRAAARVAHSFPDVTFVVVGDGELRQRVEAEGRSLLGGRCRVVGWVMDLPTLYAALDVVVLTSRNEGTPVALIEAAAAARPVVATRVGGVSDVVRDGETGLLTDARDDRALAAQMLRLLNDPGRRYAMGAAGRKWVRDRYSAERLADDIAALYFEALSRKRRSG